ncbi:MAG: ATP-binding protein [Candidatus Korarchaeota archaeon]|nr:ATP-binding protein [Candidatus Korarchaeota archaeon]
MRLEPLNPWWYDDSWAREDPHLTKFSESKYKWRPDWLDSLSLEPFSLNFVLGPRQVGKTTGLKLLIRELIEGGRDPTSLIYVNCDLIVDLRELRSVLSTLPSEDRVIVLDEVTGLDYWWRVVKGFIDQGYFSRDVLIVSGSFSVRVKRYAESFTGRRGRGRDVEVLPLSFRDFVEVRGYSLKGLERAFEEYLKLGGYPRSVNEDPTFLHELPEQVDKEVVRVGRSARIARQVIYQVVEKGPSAMSYSSIAREIGVSHVTVREYLELLEDLFVVGTAYWRLGRRVDFKKEKKVFFRDPLIPRAFYSIRGEVRREALYEWIVQEHLYRRYGEVYYYRDGYEIDVISGDLKIEVKAGKSHRRYPKGVIVLEAEDVPYFLYKLA